MGRSAKLDAAAHAIPNDTAEHNPATAHLFIVNPVRQMTAKTSALMATHPDIESRIERLHNLGA